MFPGFNRQSNLNGNIGVHRRFLVLIAAVIDDSDVLTL